MSGFTVAIVGRPNVGKSTFFNRLLEQRRAIVDDESGVTRDRQYGVAEWAGKTFNLIDTGGFVAGSEDVFEREIRKQVRKEVEWELRTSRRIRINTLKLWAIVAVVFLGIFGIGGLIGWFGVMLFVG